MKNKENIIEKSYELFHMVMFTILVLSVGLIPIILGLSVWGIGLSMLVLGAVQLIIGISARIRPSLFRLKSYKRLDIWLLLSIIDLIILGVSIQFNWFEMVFATMLIGVCLSIVQYSALTSNEFKY